MTVRSNPRFGRHVPAALLMLVLALGLMPRWSFAQMQQQGLPSGHPPMTAPSETTPSGESREGRIVGRIVGAETGTDLSGTKVVLVAFKLNEEGKPQGRPVQEQTADAEGRYVFDKVVVEPRVAYQLGANIAGSMVGSQPFTFPKDQEEISLDLPIPRVVEDAAELKIREGVVVLEPRRGVLWVTEVLHIDNDTGNTIEGEKRPLTLSIPEDAEDLEWLGQPRSEARNERLGDRLLVYGNIPPGRTTIAFRYQMDAPLGGLTLTKRYPHATEMLSVLSPKGSVRLNNPDFSRRPSQQIEGQSYDAWSLEGVAAEIPVSLNVSGIPMRQEWLLFTLLFFFIPLGGVALWFLWVRLPATREEASD